MYISTVTTWIGDFIRVWQHLTLDKMAVDPGLYISQDPYIISFHIWQLASGHSVSGAVIYSTSDEYSSIQICESKQSVLDTHMLTDLTPYKHEFRPRAIQPWLLAKPLTVIDQFILLVSTSHVPSRGARPPVWAKMTGNSTLFVPRYPLQARSTLPPVRYPYLDVWYP